MIQNFAKAVGSLCLLAAFIVVLLILITMFQVLYTPDAVGAVAVVKDFLSAQLPLISSDIKGSSDNINVDPSARLIVVYFVATIGLLALSGVLSTLIRGGVMLLKFAPTDDKGI
ncbi:hypothetical protein [Thalassotalea fusca]